MKQLFKKIFDLDPKEVEEFITKIYKDQWTRYELTFPEDMDVKINWCVPYNEFYVYTEPKLETEDYKKYSFRGKRVNLSKYFDLTFNSHSHYDFSQIYGMMTGETTFNGEVGIWPDPEHPIDYDRILAFYYHKEYTQVCHKTDGTWYISGWDDVTDKEIRKPVPTDLMAEVLKVIGNDRN